jgi:hypothetical protein
MKAFCPNCGTENEGTVKSRVTCRACTASFEVAQQPRSESPPVQSFERATPQPLQNGAPPAAVVVQPPPQVWTTSSLGASAAPPISGREHNTFAIIALVVSLLGCVCVPALGHLIGIVTGFVALSQISASNGGQKGRGLAIAGIVFGFLGCFASFAYLLFVNAFT